MQCQPLTLSVMSFHLQFLKGAYLLNTGLSTPGPVSKYIKCHFRDALLKYRFLGPEALPKILLDFGRFICDQVMLQFNIVDHKNVSSI